MKRAKPACSKKGGFQKGGFKEGERGPHMDGEGYPLYRLALGDSNLPLSECKSMRRAEEKVVSATQLPH